VSQPVTAASVRSFVFRRPQPGQDPRLSDEESRILQRLVGSRFRFTGDDRHVLDRLITPLDEITAQWPNSRSHDARNLVLAGVHRRQLAWWAWDEDTWAALVKDDDESGKARLQVVALGEILGRHRRLHHRANATRLRQLADLVFGEGLAQPAIDEVRATLAAWESSQAFPEQIINTVADLLLTSGSPHLRDITEETVFAVLTDNPVRSARRLGLFKVARVLADKRIISRPLNNNENSRGNRAGTLADVPGPWLDWARRWRKLARQESSTAKVMFSTICIAGRWTAQRHPEAVSPDLWTRDIAAEYVADTMQAKCGDWAGHNRNKTSYGRPLAASGMANRIDSLRGFFCDLIEFEWIEAKFDPRRVLSLPISLRAQMKPNPRIIDDASWAKLMAAGLTLNSEDLKPYGSPASKAKGSVGTYYPIEMLRALVGVWLFAGCRIDEIHRLELDCIVWDTGTDPHTGEQFTSCLLRVPANKTTGPFTKPVDPVVGQLVDAWKLVRPAQPDLPDRKTRQPRPHRFTWRGQLIGKAIPPRPDHPGALWQGQHPRIRLPRGAYQPPRSRHHRHPATQRPRATYSLGPAAVAGTQARRQHPLLRRDPATHPQRRLQQGRLLHP
jgi:hypothetical protein